MMSVLNDSALERLLERLHAQSDAQLETMTDYYRAREKKPVLPAAQNTAWIKDFLQDKLVALDRDKAEFCYLLCRANNARRIVEIGTSHGISTLYLAAAVRDNLRVGEGNGVVIGTEYEPVKAAIARRNFAEAGFSRLIDLREGDLRETLRQIEGPIDFLLMDIWTEMARAAIERVAPHLRVGAIVVCDNTRSFHDEYAAYFEFINEPANGFRTMTLPFDGGLEVSVRCSV